MKNLIKTALISSATFAGLSFAPAAFAGDSLEIRNFIGSINWTNGPLSAEIVANAGDTKIISRSAVTIDGGIKKIDGSDCKSSYGSYDIDWFGKKKEGRIGGYENLEDYPVLTISLPSDTKLVIENAIIFTKGTPDIGEADLSLRHCGKVNLGNIENTLALDSRGSADVTARDIGQIAVNLKGSGDLTGGNTGDVLVESHGSGDVELGNIRSIEISLHGSGDLEAGDVGGDVDISSHGSGDADLNAVTGSLTYSGHGSGDLEVTSVEGRALYLTTRGSGDIDIGGGSVDDLKIIARGSASVDYSGEAQRANLSGSGSGDITVGRVDGGVELKSSGSGKIEISERG